MYSSRKRIGWGWYIEYENPSSRGGASSEACSLGRPITQVGLRLNITTDPVSMLLRKRSGPILRHPPDLTHVLRNYWTSAEAQECRIRKMYHMTAFLSKHHRNTQ